MKTILRTLLVASLALGGSAWGASVAFLTNLKGEVALDGNPRPVLLAELSKGQKLTLGKGAQASVMFISSGREYALQGPGEFTVKDTELTALAGAAPATRDTPWRASDKVIVQVSQTSAASVRMRSIAVPKADTEPKLLYPTQGAVATLQPAFRWRAADEKAGAEFVVTPSGQEKPAHHAKSAKSAYRLPVRLQPDTEYVWTVTAAGNEIGTGRFRTLPRESLAQIEKRRPGDKAEFSDRVMFALMLHEMGAVQEARELWARLAQERSDLPELAALAR